MRPLLFNIGLNRAGTTSLTEALKVLGYRAVHHKAGPNRLYDIMRVNGNYGRELLHGLMHQYDAYSDFAGHVFYQTLDQQYPHSKFILTWREMEAWLDSREWKVRKNLARDEYRFGFKEVDREQWRLARKAYVQELAGYFASRDKDFLVIDIPGGEGWEKLCPFLGVDEPAVPFPNKNSRSL